MEGHRRLPRTGPALHDEDPGQRRADDLVLLALDGADDVAHLARPRLAQRGEERAGPAQDQPVGQQALPAAVPQLRSSGSGGRHGAGAALGIDEVLVLQPEHGPAPHGEVAAARQSLRVEPGGPVERFGDRGSPVDHERLVIRARDGEPADVEGLAQERVPGAGVVPGFGETVDAPEVESLVADVELLQPGEAGAHHDVALGARLERAAPAQVENALQHLARLAPHELQPVVGTVEELLLILQIGMFGHLSPSSPTHGETVQFRRPPTPGRPGWRRIR